MKLFFFFALAVGVIQCQHIDFPRLGWPPAKGPHPKARAATWGTTEQNIDHFDPLNWSTYKMRHVENGQFFKPGGPIFVLLGGEGPIGTSWLEYGFMYDMAMENNAYMFGPEHRYYGESLPVNPDNWYWSNYRYLSADQAMEDFAQFIRYMKVNRPQLADSKVVVFGGSYSGNLALWMRQVYPDLIHAAVSSSAPLLAKVDFEEYMQVVADVLVDCNSTIQNGLNQIREYLKTSAGATKVQNDLCRYVNINDEYSKQGFFWNMAAKFAGLIQYAGANTPRDICREIQDNNLPTDYDKFVNYMKACQRSNSAPRATPNSWFYQTCAEFGYYMSSASPNQPFYYTFTVDFWLDVCKQSFGSAYDSSITYDGAANTNQKFGALNPKTTRVVSVHGTWDPWHSLGMKASSNPDLPVYVVPGTSHCADMYSESTSDKPEMLEAKRGTKAYIKKWLSLD